MNHKNTELCKIRTITTFICLNHDKKTWNREIERASNFCSDLSKTFQSNGYTVQSIRVVTNPFGEYLDTSSYESARLDMEYISELLEKFNQSGLRMRFSLGEAKSKSDIQLLPELIKAFGDIANACVNISPDELGILDDELITESARTVVKVSEITDRGEGNFNFTAVVLT